MSISVETQLKVKYKDNESDNLSITNEAKNMIENINSLVAMVSDKTRFKGKRINGEYSGEFIRVDILCLVPFTTSQTRRYKYYDTDISNIVVVIDKALARLLLEHSVSDYLAMINQNRILTRTCFKPRYTK
jgi:hypothetical protein